MKNNNHTFVIAEAGVNHNGFLKIAMELVEAAAAAKADAIKFQTFKAEKIVCSNAEKAKYQRNTTGNNESQFEMLRKLELSASDHIVLLDYCKKLNIKFLSTPFDKDSINLLNDLGLDTFKIPSGEITNLPYLRALGRLNKKIFLSTGMATIDEVKLAYNILKDAGTSSNKIVVLHANTEYPTPYEDVNLNAMLTIKKELGVNVGYSDHTLGVEVPIAAVALGATVIEKHFTLDRNMEGPDHRASLEPHELKVMVKAIRNIEIALGSNIKTPSKSEKKNIPIVRKSIVALKNISKGEFFTETNITVKRPGTGISPIHWDKVIGLKATKKYLKDEMIYLDDC